jgi:lysozyme
MEPINMVIDLSHWNNVASFQEVKNDGIVGVIHKATEGFDYVDPDYLERRSLAQAAGLMWGSDHFGVGGDDAEQAKFFLSTVQPGPHDLLALDLEENPVGSSMTLQEAEAFVNQVQSATARWPGVYSGGYIKGTLGNPTNTLLANCWLWLAQWEQVPVVPAAWEFWTLWQYTDGQLGLGPYSVVGVGMCDRDKFNGPLVQLRKLWGYKEMGDGAPQSACNPHQVAKKST